MYGLLLAACLLAAPPAANSATSVELPPSKTIGVAAPPQAPPRSLQEWRDVVQQAMKEQSRASQQEQPAAILKLVQIYRELLVVGQLPSGEDKRLRMLVRGRLLRLREELPQDLRSRQAKIEAVEARAKREKQPAMLDKIADDKIVLAQWRDAMGQFLGPQQGGGARQKDDDGPELVDLIQAVISPDFWDVNGGPGAIVYFPSLHVMVVRATTQTHYEVAALLDALRRAGN